MRSSSGFATASEVGHARRRAALLFTGGVLAGVSLWWLVAGVHGPADPSIVKIKERMQGSSLIVELICEEALFEETFVEYLAGRFDEDVRRHAGFEEYRFRLSLIPEGGGDPISVLFSYMFFDRQGEATSRVEAFEFLVPRADAGAIATAGPAVRRTLYEALREDQPRLNPNFARRRRPSGAEAQIEVQL